MSASSSSPSPAAAGTLAIWSSSDDNGRRNLLHGLQTQTWGFKAPHADYRKPIRWVVFGYDHSLGSPRQKLPKWETGTVSVSICELTAPFYEGSSFHWPDEALADRVIYPVRMGITAIGHAAALNAASTGPLGPVSEALNISGMRGHGVWVQHNLTSLLGSMGLSLNGAGRANLSSTSGVAMPSVSPVRAPRGGGRSRSSDPAWNSAVESHAVRMATQHLSQQGWTEITPLGKPYDLVCRRPDGTEKHVEVKGTAGAGANVAFTPNEVEHFRSCPYGADLVVVRDISVDSTSRPYRTAGGKLLHKTDYRAPATDLQATGWLGRVEGW